MIPARIITRPESRTLQMMTGRHGLFDQNHEPFALRRAPFRITRETLTPADDTDAIDAALAVLAELAPHGANWLGSKLLELGGGGVWRVQARFWVPTTSRRLSAPPLIERTTDAFFATLGLPRMPDGMHRIGEPSGPSLLHRRP
jgi:hypothetical protein